MKKIINYIKNEKPFILVVLIVLFIIIRQYIKLNL